jgi:ParB family transcriptional regulator, chromosome partitioning protein
MKHSSGDTPRRPKLADAASLLDPRQLIPNPENPRLIFHEDELEGLQESIKLQGVLVPLSVYQDGRRYVILDGERRWRCAVKLALDHVPAVVQPKPDRLQNIMMMFAIHNARRDWDPLPTALKLQELEGEFTKRQGRAPTEVELAELASLTRGEVRRLKNLLRLPKSYLDELMDELEKPRSQQVITVDHVLETTRGAAALRRREVISEQEEDQLRRAILNKFRSKVINNTVAPRQLARIARAVERQEVPIGVARRVTAKLIGDAAYSIDDAFAGSVEQVDFEHTIEQSAERLTDKLSLHHHRGYEPGDALRASLKRLERTIKRVLAH